MNRYRVTTFTYGQSNSFIVEGFDIIAAIQNSGVNATEIVKAEFVGSSNEVDMTQG